MLMNPMSRRSFLGASATAALAADTTQAQTQERKPNLQPLPTPVQAKLLGWQPPIRPFEQQVKELLGDLRSRARIVVPLATHVDDDAVLYITVREDPSVAHFVFENPAGDNGAVMALLFTTGAQEALGDRSRLKAVLGREFAHHILQMNPDVCGDPRFRPSTEAFRREFDSTKFVVLRMDLATDMLRPTDPFVPTGAAEEQAVKQIVAKKKGRYIEDLQADRLGIWLSTDLGAAMDIPGMLASHRAADAVQRTSEPFSPRASRDVRSAEIQAAYEDMKKKEAAGRLMGSREGKPE